MEGIILKGVGGRYIVRDLRDDSIHEVKLRGKFRLEKITPLPGDRVEYSREKNEEVINKVVNRKNFLIRPQIANVTQVFLIFALKDPDINWDLVNSFLLYIEKLGVKAVIIFNKKDLVEESYLEEVKSYFINTGYEILFISARDLRDPKGEIKGLLKEELTVLAGPSGAGKSTLLNGLLGEKKMDVGEVSAKIGRGKHTTRHTELVEVSNGYLADSPGFSNLELVNIEAKNLVNYFPEMEDYVMDCKWQGCSHVKEEGCKIKEMVGKTISSLRYDFYKRMYIKLKEGEKRKWD